MKKIISTFVALTLAGPTLANTVWSEIKSHEFCYERAYSKQHLVKHPKQTVTHIRFWSAKSKAFADAPPMPVIAANFRDDRLTYENFVSCYEKDHGANCYGDCDSGGFIVEKRDDSTIRIRFNQDHQYVLLGSGCGDDNEKFRHLGRGEDDKVFKLVGVDPAKCRDGKTS